MCLEFVAKSRQRASIANVDRHVKTPLDIFIAVNRVGSYKGLLSVSGDDAQDKDGRRPKIKEATIYDIYPHYLQNGASSE